MGDVTVVIATFGGLEWAALALRAAESARDQAPVITVHGDTLASARNEALRQVDTEWVIHLDADDELEPGYVQALSAGSCDLRAPAVRYVRGRREFTPYVPKVPGHGHGCSGDCLPDGNFLVVGSMARAQLLRDVGGWEEWLIYEDWALWLRCWQAGATVEAIPEAVYRAHVRLDSRNRAPSMATKNRVHREIVDAILPSRVAA